MGSCQADFRYRELFVFILLHIISFEACTVRHLYITGLHFDTSLFDIHWLVHLHVPYTESSQKCRHNAPVYGYTNCAKIWVPSQNLRCQNGEMKQISHWRPRNLWCHVKKIDCSGNLVPGICASLLRAYFDYSTVGSLKNGLVGVHLFWTHRL
jgi:hypothetical protein